MYIKNMLMNFSELFTNTKGQINILFNELILKLIEKQELLNHH